MDFQWRREVENLKEKAAEFVSVFSRLQELEPVARADPAAVQKYNSLMERGAVIRERISYVTGLIDKAFSWFNEQGSSPPETVANLQGLGVLWVPVTLVAGAIAAIVAWLSDAYVSVKELETAQALIAQGVAPADAYKIAREGNKGLIGGFFEGIRDNFILFAALGLAAWWLTNRARKSGG